MSFLEDLPSTDPKNFSQMTGSKIVTGDPKVAHHVPIRSNEISITNEKKTFVLRYLEKHYRAREIKAAEKEKKSRKRADEEPSSPNLQTKLRKR